MEIISYFKQTSVENVNSILNLQNEAIIVGTNI